MSGRRSIHQAVRGNPGRTHVLDHSKGLGSGAGTRRVAREGGERVEECEQKKSKDATRRHDVRRITKQHKTRRMVRIHGG